MLPGFQNQAVYFGTLDDVVDRYPWQRVLDLNALRQQLVTAAIYDKTVLINDGYLVANPMLLPDLQDFDTSLMGSLLTSGQARLFTRSGDADLAGGIVRTAEGVASHRTIVDDRQSWPKIRDRLETLRKVVRGRTLVWPRDKNMGQLFHMLMGQIRNLPGDTRKQIIPADMDADFDSIFDDFDKLIAANTVNGQRTYDGARTIWEETAWRRFAPKRSRMVAPSDIANVRDLSQRALQFEGYAKVRAMMNIANEAYHFAYAAAAGRSLKIGPDIGLGGRRIGVACALVTVFPALLTGEQTDKTDDAASMPQSNTYRLQEFLRRLTLQLPPDLEFSGDYGFLRKLELDGELSESRMAYLAGLDNFAAGTTEFDPAYRLAFDYADILADRMFKHLKKPKWWTAYARGSDFFLNTPALSAAIAFPAVPAAVGLAAGVGTWAIATLIDHYRNPYLEVLGKNELSVRLMQSALHAASNPLSGVPVREHGFFMGALDSNGVESLTSKSGPHPSLLTPNS